MCNVFRGGLIWYRTTVKGLALAANSVLDVGEPVRDYAKVGTIHQPLHNAKLPLKNHILPQTLLAKV